MLKDNSFPVLGKPNTESTSAGKEIYDEPWNQKWTETGKLISHRPLKNHRIKMLSNSCALYIQINETLEVSYVATWR